MVHRIGFFNRIIQGSQAHPDRIDTPAEQRVSKLVGDVDGQAGHGDTLRAYASRKIKPLTPATAVRYLAGMANQNALTFIALSALLGCGTSSPPMPPSGPVGIAPECDQYAFLVAFMRSNITSRIEIICERRGPTTSIWQEFTEYSNGATTVTYWANARAVRVEGVATDCIRGQLNEVIPRAPLMISECVRMPIGN